MALLFVEGFDGKLHNLNGTYAQSTRENHGRPVFVKAVKGHDKQQSCVYFWDERDGADMVGWWMAPVIGGEHVWTHNPKCDRIPPKVGWKVPWHGDPDLKVTFLYQAAGTRLEDKGRNDQGRNDHGRNDHGRNDYGRNDHGRNDSGKGKSNALPQGKGKNDLGKGGKNDLGKGGKNDLGKGGKNDLGKEGKTDPMKGRSDSVKGKNEPVIGRSDRVIGRSERVIGRSELVKGKNDQKGGKGQQHILPQYETHSTAGKGATNERGAASMVGIPQQQQQQPTSSSTGLPGGVVSLARGKGGKDSGMHQRQQQLHQQQQQQLQFQQQHQHQLQLQQQPLQQHQLFAQQQQLSMQWQKQQAEAQVQLQLQQEQLRRQQEQQRLMLEQQRQHAEQQRQQAEQQRQQAEQQQRVVQEQQRKMQEEQERKAAEERRRKQLLERERLAEQKRNEEEKRRQMEVHREEQKVKEKEVKALLETEVMEKLTEFEDRMEACKDASAVLTSDVADHLTPEDTIAAYDEGKDIIGKSYAIYMDVTTQLKNLDAKINDPIPATTELQQHHASISKRLQNIAQPFLVLREVCEKYGRKGKKELAEQERLAGLEEQRELKKRAAEWNVAIFGRVAEDVIIGEMAVKKARKNSAALPDAVVALRRTTMTLEDAIANDNATSDTQAELRTLLKRTRASFSAVSESCKRMKCEEGNKEELLGIELARKLQTLKKELQFAKFSTKGQMSRKQFLNLAASVGMTADSALVFDEALRISQKPALSLSNYQLYIQARYLRVVTADSVLCETEEETEGTTIEVDEVLKALSAPMTVDGVQKCHVERLKDSTTGYVIARQDGKNLVERFTPRFVCVQETVLTDSLELKGFKVLKRLKEGDTFEAHEVPVASKVSGLLRIRGQSSGIVGWTTIRGNQGTCYLKGVDTTKMDGDIDQKPVEPLADNERDGVLQMLKNDSLEQIEAALEQVANSCELLDTRCLEVTAIFDASPSKEQITETTIKLDEAQTAAQSSLTSAKTILLEKARLVSKCTTDNPLGQLRQALSEIPTKLNAQQAQVLTMMHDAQQQILQLLKNEDARLRHEALAKAKEDVVEWEAQLAKYEEEVTDEVAKAELVAEEYAVDLGPLDTCIANAISAIQKANNWIEGILPREGSHIVHYQKFRRNVGQFRTRVFKVNKKIDALKESRGELEKKLSTKARLLIGIGLLNYMKEKSLTAEQIFDGAVEIDISKFLHVLLEAEVTAADEFLVRHVFDTFGPVITPDEFSFIAQPRYLVLKATAMTDTFEMKGSKNVVRVAEDDVIDCLGMPEVDEETKVTRMKASFAGTEGFMTIKGNAGTEFLTPYLSAYVVKVETVMTSILQMKGFKVLRRLRFGEILNTCVPPARDNGGLLRIKGTMPDGIEGWVTVIGSNGIRYLENCERLTAAEIEAKEAAKKAEIAAKEAAKKAEADTKETGKKVEAPEGNENLEDPAVASGEDLGDY